MPTPPVITDPTAALIDLAVKAKQSKKRMILGLVGLPGAGKSTQAQLWTKQVNESLGEASMQTLGMDGFHLTRAQLQALPNAEQALARRGADWTFDAVALRTHLQKLRQQDQKNQYLPCPWPDFNHHIGDPIEQALHIAPETHLVLIEGLYLLLPYAPWALKPLFDKVWFLNLPREKAEQQLIQRHQTVWNWSAHQARQRLQDSDKLNADLVESTRILADAEVVPTRINGLG